MGAGDKFTEVTDRAYREGGLKNFAKLFNDILLFRDSVEDLAETFRLFCEINRQHHLTVQPKKLQYCGETDEPANFSGMAVSSKGVGPNPEKLAGVEKFPSPTDREGVMRFMGLIRVFWKY